MTKREFACEVARRGRNKGLTKRMSFVALESMIEVLTELAMNNDKVVITGFATIGSKTIAPKNIINPCTREPMTTSESRKLYIKTGAVLRRKLNNKA